MTDHCIGVIDVVQATRKCSIEGCENTVESRGWCVKHYTRWKRHGDPHIKTAPKTIRLCELNECTEKHHAFGLCRKHYQKEKRLGRLPGAAQCSIEDCNSPALARSMCNTHYQRWIKHGDPLQTIHRTSCALDGCDGKHKAHGYCDIHYRRYLKHGDPSIVLTQAFKTPEESFDHRTERDGECLNWTGATSIGGYGLIIVDSRNVYAHRWVWEKYHGEIPEELEVDHICHNRSCVNVDHLRLATRAENCWYRSGAGANNKHSGVRNVHKWQHGWRVLITKNYKLYDFGFFKNVDEAAEIAAQKRKELFGDFAGKG